ncbi:MAG: SRPBCC domain-containing protein [Bryobacteraceae bacterium]
MEKTKTIRQKELIPGVTPGEVYEALTNASRHSAFTGSRATGAARAGSKFTAWDGYITGKHLELEKGKRIVQEWTTSEWPEGQEPSRIEWTFNAKKGGTEVTMVHSKVPASQVESYRQGWIDYYWEPLKQHFAARS